GISLSQKPKFLLLKINSNCPSIIPSSSKFSRDLSTKSSSHILYFSKNNTDLSLKTQRSDIKYHPEIAIKPSHPEISFQRSFTQLTPMFILGLPSSFRPISLRCSYCDSPWIYRISRSSG